MSHLLQGQGSLLPPEEALDSLFFAILPDSGLQQDLTLRATAFKRSEGLRGALRPPELLHVSLHAAVDLSAGLPPDRVRHAQHAGNATDWPAPFDMVFDTAMRFGGDAVVFTGQQDEAATGFAVLHAALARALRAHGFKVKNTAQPHVSVMYGRASFPPRSIVPLRWSVHEVALIHSHVGKSRYDVLKRWPLR